MERPEECFFFITLPPPNGKVIRETYIEEP